MVRMLILGFVVVLATLGGSFAAMKMSHSSSSAPEHPKAEAEAVVKLEPTSVPIIRDGKIQGYVVGRFAFSSSAGELGKNKDTLVLYVSEAIFRAVYEEEQLNFASLKLVQVDTLVKKAVETANARIGRPAIKQVFAENMSFLPYDSVRCQQVK